MPITNPFNQWITCPQPNPQATLRLFCLPYAGGGALSFRGWANHLYPLVEVCPIELPARGLRLGEPAFTQFEPLVEAIANALFPYLDKPFAFFGHSMGGLISFQLTRQLRRNGWSKPIHLLISGRRAPQVPQTKPPIYSLPESAFLEELRRFNGTPVDVLENAELMQMLLPTLRADFEVVETYRYVSESLLDCPITVFGGLQDPETSVDLLEAWQEQTTAAFSLQWLPGDHFFLHTAQPHLLKLLTHALRPITQFSASNQ
jgi:medium-chain acyl-[acyl-carrier-protein] hydrolase